MKLLETVLNKYDTRCDKTEISKMVLLEYAFASTRKCCANIVGATEVSSPSHHYRDHYLSTTFSIRA